MVKASDVRWPLERHTLAKHKILRRYLDAWIPIMVSEFGRVCLIDGFAGPGRYLGGEKGSPLIMLDAFLEHTQRSMIEGRGEVGFIFIEKHAGRHAWLVSEVDGVKAQLPPTWKPPVVWNRDFGDVIEKLLSTLGKDGRPVGTFLFIDPFGYAETRPELSAKILGYPRCEVLIFLPVYFIARFIDDPDLAATFDNLFGSNVWRAAAESSSLAARKTILHDLFIARLRESAEFVRSFEIETAPTSSYHLFFASNNIRGLEKMKDAMWSVDPVAGTRYSDSTAPGQELLFGEAADLGILEGLLRTRFDGRWFTISEARRFTMVETHFNYKHLVTYTLKRLELAKRLQVLRTGPKRAGTYPTGTRIRLLG